MLCSLAFSLSGCLLFPLALNHQMEESAVRPTFDPIIHALSDAKENNGRYPMTLESDAGVSKIVNAANQRGWTFEYATWNGLKYTLKGTTGSVHGIAKDGALIRAKTDRLEWWN